jgi:superfamily II DNA/RNA helicase
LNSFAELGLSKPILASLVDAGYVQPTDIQRETISLILSGKDVLASAQTGSGKTAAFALPIVECLEQPERKPRALVLAPTRELALQISDQFRIFAKNFGLNIATIYGGTGMEQQLRTLRGAVDVIVATPGRLLDCMERKAVDLSTIEIIVLDEADRLLDLGFMPQLSRIRAKLPKERQTLMFSATIDAQVSRIAQDFSEEFIKVRVQKDQIEPVSIDQKFLNVDEFSKDALLLKLLGEWGADSVLVFTRTKRKATWVKDRLRDALVSAEEIHGDISQVQREKTLKKYRQGNFPVLIATDVAARGLDIPSISHVINYDLPDSAEDYVHRIGRTGRAGRSGTAVSFVSDEQRHLVKDIEKLVGKQLDNSPVPMRKPLARGRFGRGRR